LRVLLIHQAFASPEDAGGTRHYELARHLVLKGHRVVIVASNLSYLTGQPVAGAGKEEWLDGIRVLRAWTLPVLHKSFVWRIVSFFSFMVTSVLASLKAGRADLVVGTSPPIFQAASAWLVSVLRACPFLLEVRDLWPAFAIDMGVLRNPLLIVMSRWLERFLYNRARHILVNSPAYRDYLLGLGIPPGKVTLIPNGVDPGLFDSGADGGALRRKWGRNGKFVVTYAGALGMANDIPTVLRAAERMKDEPGIQFVFAGDGKERVNLERQAGKRGLSNVTFAGALPKRRMPEVLAASDACLAILKDIPMFRTTYPNKVFDYMAAARPTILAIDGVIREVVEASGGGVFVTPGNDAALADAVRALSRDRERCRSMGAAARAYVCEHFDRNRQAESFRDLVERIARR
jgi:glycosyltransferase involved in cell wall biosynthesis